MEECPKCNKWTLAYNPKTETKTCMKCHYKEYVKYELFVEQSNVIDSLHYPNHKSKKNLEKIKI